MNSTREIFWWSNSGSCFWSWLHKFTYVIKKRHKAVYTNYNKINFPDFILYRNYISWNHWGNHWRVHWDPSVLSSQTFMNIKWLQSEKYKILIEIKNIHLCTNNKILWNILPIPWWRTFWKSTWTVYITCYNTYKHFLPAFANKKKMIRKNMVSH